LNYAFEEDPPLLSRSIDRRTQSRLHPALPPHRFQTDLSGKDVLEVSCGHGGGASYLARTMRPQSYTALDLNPSGIAFCTQRHRVDGLSFVQGNAQRLPFADASFDA